MTTQTNDRKVVQVYEDELEQFIDLFDAYRKDCSALENTMADFVDRNNLNQKFKEHLEDIKNKADEDEESYDIILEIYGDVHTRLQELSYLFDDEKEKAQ